MGELSKSRRVRNLDTKYGLVATVTFRQVCAVDERALVSAV